MPTVIAAKHFVDGSRRNRLKLCKIPSQRSTVRRELPIAFACTRVRDRELEDRSDDAIGLMTLKRNSGQRPFLDPFGDRSIVSVPISKDLGSVDPERAENIRNRAQNHISKMCGRVHDRMRRGGYGSKCHIQFPKPRRASTSIKDLPARSDLCAGAEAGGSAVERCGELFTAELRALSNGPAGGK